MRKSSPKEAAPSAPSALRRLAAFHADVDARAQQLAGSLGDRIHCGRGCAACCVDDLTVFRVEAARIREHHRTLLDAGEAHAPGACAFLDGDGACRVYEVRPYVCRTQGLPLRWFDDASEPVERRDICPLNEAGPPLERLPDEQCWTLGPHEGDLFEIASQFEGGAPRRVALRSLFAAADPARDGEP